MEGMPGAGFRPLRTDFASEKRSWDFSASVRPGALLPRGQVCALGKEEGSAWPQGRQPAVGGEGGGNTSPARMEDSAPAPYGEN